MKTPRFIYFIYKDGFGYIEFLGKQEVTRQMCEAPPAGEIIYDCLSTAEEEAEKLGLILNRQKNRS